MRLLTRSDFDGLVCGALLKDLGVIDSWTFVHPKDMQDGLVEVTTDDVLANVPYVAGCGMWFDHHSTEIARMGKDNLVAGECRLAPSCARVIYEYYKGSEKLRKFDDLVAACDRVDSGHLTIDEINKPEGWVLIGFIMDPRTGLGRFRDFTVSNYDLMVNLLDACAVNTLDEILAMPDVAERVSLYHEQESLFEEMVKKHTRIVENVIITDLRGVETINAGNRFRIYGLYPAQNVSLWIVDGRGKANCPIAVGYSVLNRTCHSDIGKLMYHYGGGGHHAVGTCQVPYEDADRVIGEIVTALVSDCKNP